MSYVQKKETNNNLINGIMIGVAILIVAAMAVVVSKNKNLGTEFIQEVTYSEYKEVIKNPDYTVVLLASPTCSHCREYKPFVNAVAEEYDFKVYYVNVHSSDLTNEQYDEIHDNNSVLKDQFDSEGGKVIPTPTTIIYQNNKEVASALGDIGYDKLKSFLKENGVIK